MESKPCEIPTLIKFNREEYFQSDVDHLSKGNLPYVELNQNGIDLISQYYSYKYHMEGPIKTRYVRQIIEKIKSEDFSEIRNKKEDVRTAFLITGTHSTPVVYVKENGKELLLIFDSLGDTSMAKIAALALPEIDVYTSISIIRQRDSYSCHSEALVLLRELTGKDDSNHFLIPNISHKLEENTVKDSLQNEYPCNLHEIKLFDSLLITIQNPPFMEAHEQQYKSKEVIHTYKGKPEQIKEFLERYPPEERGSIGKKPNVSNYLREKGLKFSQIIEIQFYLNQLKNFLGNQFTEKLRENFITDAKAVFKINRYSFLAKDGDSNLYDVAAGYLESNLNYSETTQSVSKKV